MNKCMNSLRLRDVGIIAALPFVVGLPFLWVQYFLFGPSRRVLPLLTSHFCLSSDALTTVGITLYCLLFALALLMGNRFLRRFLSPESWER